MKIRIRKDIPGYKAGQVVNIPDDEIFYAKSILQGFPHSTLVAALSDGFAEEIKDEIDIEGVRGKYQSDLENGLYPGCFGINKCSLKLSSKEAEWFTAYRIVKHIIDTLNGEDQIGSYYSYELLFLIDKNKIDIVRSLDTKMSLLPFIKDKITAEKVISLCEPELKVLFGVK